MTMMQVPMHTDIDDPFGRLAAIHESTSRSKAAQHGVAAETLREMSQAIPGALIGVAMRGLSALPLEGPVVSNTLVTNVPGPKDPLYFAGARLVWTTGMGPLARRRRARPRALPATSTSSLVQVTSDREQLPDIEFYMECLNDSIEELKSIAKPTAAKARRRPAAAVR